MHRPIADKLREYAKCVADGSVTYCEAPITLLECAADLIDQLEAQQPPIDGTGWAEAAFVTHHPAEGYAWVSLPGGIKGDDHLVTDELRGQGE